MNLLDYLPHNAIKRLEDEQVNDLPITDQIVYAVTVPVSGAEIWVLKGEENDFHLWEMTCYFKAHGEDSYMSHALIHSLAVEYSMHDILDQLNAALKAKHPH